jgi:uncharacterized SAM-dependent methyltransferase
MRQEAKPGGALLMGVDLVKDAHTIEAAYNDTRGVTAEFNRNVLLHLNAALGSNFLPQRFCHEAIYDVHNHRIEMRLVSLTEQSVHVDGETIRFAAGEHILTEYSHKYSIEHFRTLARQAGLQPEGVWTDADELFSVHYLTAPAS